MGSAVLQLHVRRGPPHDDGVARARARVELATLTLAVARARCRACARLRAHTAFWPLQVANKSAQRRLSKCTRRQRKRCRNGRHSIDKEKEEEAEDKISYLQKAKTLYFTPVSFILLVACALQAFCHYSITIWSPVIAATRFAGKDLSEVNFALTVGVLLSIPLALAVNGVLLRHGAARELLRVHCAPHCVLDYDSLCVLVQGAAAVHARLRSGGGGVRRESLCARVQCLWRHCGRLHDRLHLGAHVARHDAVHFGGSGERSAAVLGRRCGVVVRQRRLRARARH